MEPLELGLGFSKLPVLNLSPEHKRRELTMIDQSSDLPPSGAPSKFVHQDVNKLGIASALLKGSKHTPTYPHNSARHFAVSMPDRQQSLQQLVALSSPPSKARMERTPTSRMSSSLPSVRTSVTSTSPKTAT